MDAPASSNIGNSFGNPVPVPQPVSVSPPPGEVPAAVPQNQNGDGGFQGFGAGNITDTASDNPSQASQAPEPVVFTPPSGGGNTKKIVAGVLGVLLLVGGVAAGVYGVQRNQQAERSKAGDSNYCEGRCCYANTGGGFYVQKCTCSNPLAPGVPCLDNCVNAGDTACIPDNFCGAMQLDVRNAVGEAGTELAILMNGNGVCEAPPPGGTTPPVVTPTPTPLAICGEACNTDNDCSDATFPGVDVVCRQGECVNRECFDRGGETTFGTLCTCSLSTGVCGDECGGDIGLCDTGYSCTYAAQSQCSPSKHGFCVPSGTEASKRGPMQGVQEYNGTPFERRQCGAGTSDAQNNYIYHQSFPNHLFTKAEVLQYICNPATPTPSPTPNDDFTAQCLTVLAYDIDWNLLTSSQLAGFLPGDQVYFTVKGIFNGTSTQLIQKARFTINGTLRAEVTSLRPGTSDEYYDLYTVPGFASGQSSLTISVKGELYQPEVGWF